MAGGQDERRSELLRQGAEADGVELVEYESRHRPGTSAERRARRPVLLFWALAAVAGAAAIAHYIVWPWKYVPPQEPGYALYQAYTPLLGMWLGLSLIGVFGALINHVRRVLPKETAVQQRHPTGPSSEKNREIFVATVEDAADNVGIRRRSVFGRAMGIGAGVAGASVAVIGVGGFVESPWQPGPRRGEADTLWHTGWYPEDGEKVYLRIETADPEQVALVRPGDIDPGGLLAVFPFRESERGNPQQLKEVLSRADNPATLFRFRPGERVEYRPDRAGMNYGDYYVFSRICTHLGCAVNLWEKQVNRLLCPCHQSQFDLNQYAKPIFGPAARPLPQLPISVDESGFFYATGDFTGPVGPTFWELPK